MKSWSSLAPTTARNATVPTVTAALASSVAANSSTTAEGNCRDELLPLGLSFMYRFIHILESYCMQDPLTHGEISILQFPERNINKIIPIQQHQFLGFARPQPVTFLVRRDAPSSAAGSCAGLPGRSGSKGRPAMPIFQGEFFRHLVLATAAK